MELPGIDHLFEIAPPYMKNRETPAMQMQEEMAAIRKERPDIDEQSLWEQAAEKVRAGDRMLWFGVLAVSMPESDKLEREIINLYNDYARDKAAEMESGKRLELVKSKVRSINNLKIGDKEITTFDDFYRLAPKDLVQWLCAAVHSTLTLTGAERKNFLPG